MTTESDPAVTRVTVILDTPNDWLSWLFIRKDSCRRHELWQYVNPDTPKGELPELTAPIEPQYKDYNVNATRLADLSTDDRSSYRWDYERYERLQNTHNKKVQALADFNLEISKTIAKRRLYLIQDCDTAYDRLVTLKKHLAPDVATRRHELTAQYNALKTAPRAIKKIEQWLADWTRITSMCKSVNLPDTEGIRPQEDFLVACKDLDSEYATTCLRDVYRAENAGTTSQLPTLEDYVSEFTNFLRRNKPHSSGLATNVAELEAANTANTTTTSSSSRTVPTCICGDKHYYADCFIINDKHPKRPRSYKPSTEKLRKVIEARKDPKTEQRIKVALEKRAKYTAKASSSSGPIQLDDGLPPSGNDSFAISMSAKPDSPIDVSSAIHADSAVAPADTLTTMSLGKSVNNNLLTRWIVDPGSNTHVINSEAWKGWTRERENRERQAINAGSGTVEIMAWGRMELVVNTPRGQATLLLTHVAFCRGFLTSLIGLARCRTMAIHFDSGRDVLYQSLPHNVVANLEYNGGHWLIDSDPLRRPKLSDLQSFGISYRPSYAPKPVHQIDQLTAHKIWGHPSKKAIEHLEANVNGISIIGDKLTDCTCQTCIESRLTKIVSRRPSADKATRPFYRIGIDLIYIVPMAEQCWNGDRYALHAVDEFSKWHEILTIRKKDKPTLVRWFMALVRKIQRVFNHDVIMVHTDGERGFGNDLIDICKALGIVLELTPPAHSEQNGLIEGHNRVVTLRARALRINANLPKKLANEMYKSAVYILNRTPTEALQWKTPYEIVWGRQPLGAHMYPIGCRAYARNRALKAADKTESRALIGHLVGYQGTNIFHVWLPTKDDVFVTRDVVFDADKYFTGDELYAHESVIEEVIELLEYPPSSEDDDIELEDLLTRRQCRNNDTTPATPDTGSQVGGENSGSKQNSESKSKVESKARTETKDSEVPEGYRAYGAVASKDINLDFDTSNIITGKRHRRGRDPDVFAVNFQATNIGITYVPEYLYTFANETSKLPHDEDLPRIHQNQLPPVPKHIKDLDTHKFGAQFREALQKEWRSLRAKGCFRKSNLTKSTADAEVLPLMWVFTYKVSQDGFLTAFKARLVIRGDLQDPLEDTYAATLAIRNFRAMIAIANYFDMELRQYDVPTAFLNARLNRKLYAQTPDGVHHLEHVELLEVLRALYGLKESPLLWYEELKSTLIKLGLKPVEGFPCLYTNSTVILFVYVDDIVMAYHRSNAQEHQVLEQQLIDAYDLKTIGDLAWFLGIRVVRDRLEHKTWLILDAYIEKICSRFNINLVGKYPDIPLLENWLPQSNEDPDKARTKLYQQLVGSLAYIAVWGRPDVARAHVVFACHLTNPGQSHVSKVRKTWEYLLGTKGYALEASASKHDLTEYITDDPNYKDPLFFGSSDASYADEPETRRSSQGYVFKFGGMTVDWKATVQRTVTKSTTESELLALSLAGSQMQEWLRFFKGISLTLNCKPTIWCDNQQTVGIVTKSQDRLHTKVKHVDIHQLWVRQEVAAARLDVVWVPTDKMPADGLTKVLPRQKFKEFVSQLGLVDITTRLNSLKAISIPDLNVLYPNRS